MKEEREEGRGGGEERAETRDERRERGDERGEATQERRERRKTREKREGPPFTRRGGRNIVQTERSIEHYFQMRKNNYLHIVFSFLNFDVPNLFLVVAHQDQEGTTQVRFKKAAVCPVG